MKISVKKIVFYGLMLALSLALSVTESFIPFSIPGLKLGLANIIILLVLSNFGFSAAFAINIGRVVLTSLIVGNFLQMGFFMSLFGALISMTVMFFAIRIFKRLTMVGVSILGSFFHVLAQICVASFYFSSGYVFYYFPIMMAFSLLTGVIIGFIVLSIESMKSFYKLKQKLLKDFVEEN